MTARLFAPVLIAAYVAVLPAACSATPELAPVSIDDPLPAHITAPADPLPAHVAAPAIPSGPVAGPVASPLPVGSEPPLVMLLHGLGRSSHSMAPLAEGLHAAGFRVENVDYPSTDATFEALAARVRARIEAHLAREAGPIHIVTHSMGGLLVRAAFDAGAPPGLGRVVMLAPPNQGSELVDELGEWAVFRWATGEAGASLGTGPDGVAAQLGPVDFEVGVITGDTSLNPLYSSLIPGPDDGKVSVESAKVDGMRDFLVMPHSHTFIMRRHAVIGQVVHFLRAGAFDRRDPDD